jgi:PKD repeat protein
MSYTIYKADGTPVTVVDNAVDTTYYNTNAHGAGIGIGTQLVGRNTINYGAPIAQNFLQMTENFASSALYRPTDAYALQGQLWFDKTSPTTGTLCVRTSSATTGGDINWAKVVTADYTTGDVNITGTLTASQIVGTVVGSISMATNLAGGNVGYVPYQSAPGTTAFLPPATVGQILTSNGPGTAPSWQPAPSLSNVPIINPAVGTEHPGDIQVNGAVISIFADGAWRQIYPGSSSPALPPFANFDATPTTGSTPLTVNFTDTSTNNPTSWLWDFGDGSPTSTLQNPTHIYTTTTNPGEYFSPTLTATNAAGTDPVTKPNLIYPTLGVFNFNPVVSTNVTGYDVFAAAVAAGWNQVVPLVTTITIGTGIIVSSNSTTAPAINVSGNFPAGSAVTVVNNGYIIGMGGAGGNGRTQTYVGKSLVVATYETSGLAGGPAITVAPTVPGNIVVSITNNGTIGGGGGGGGGAASIVQTTSPGGGGGRTGSTNSAGGGGGYGSYPGTFAGAGAGLVPSSHGNSGSGGNWGAGGAVGYAWPGDNVVTNGGAGGPATIGNAYITWVLAGTRYGALT